MEFRQLELFIDVVRLRSFTKAAERQFVTQPAVSLAVRRLEDDLGVVLIERTRSGARVTVEGRRLFEHAVALLRARDVARRDVAGDGEIGGELRLGTTDAVSAYLFPDIFREFRRRYPGVTLQVRVDSSRRLADAVVGAELDLAVLNLPAPIEGLITRPVVEESLVLIAAPGHPVIGPAKGRRARLAGASFIAYPARSVTRRVIDEALRRAGVEPRVEMEMGSPDAMKQLVAVGIGVSVLPHALVEGELRQGRLVEIALTRFRARRTLGFATSSASGVASVAQAFIETTEQLVGKRAKRP